MGDTAARPAEARALAKALRRPRAARAIARIEDISLRTPHTDIAARLYSDRPDPKAVIRYFHGGGWVLGSLEQSDVFARAMVAQSGCVLLSIDYRLATGGGLSGRVRRRGCRTHLAYRESDDDDGRQRRRQSCRDPGNARDRGIAPAVARILVNPVTDSGMDRDSYREFAEGPLLTAPLTRWFWGHYIADPQARLSPCVTPARQGRGQGREHTR